MSKNIKRFINISVKYGGITTTIRINNMEYIYNKNCELCILKHGKAEYVRWVNEFCQTNPMYDSHIIKDILSL